MLRHPHCAKAAARQATEPDPHRVGVRIPVRSPLFGSWHSARGLGLARILVGVAALIRAGVTYGILNGVFAVGNVRIPYVPVGFEPGESAIGLMTLAWAAAALGFALGWHTRLFGVVLAGLMAFTLILDQQTYSNHLYLLILVTVLLVVADAGAALSLDARRTDEREVPGWPVMLLRIQTSIVYGFAALWKMNLTYLSGAVLYAFLPRTGWLALPESMVTVTVLAPLAILSVMAEAFLAVMVWRPTWRHQAFALAFLLHAGMVLFVDPTGRLQIVVFALVMFALLLQFLPTDRESRRVVWDGHCSFCGTWILWFKRLDWLGVHSFVRSQDLDPDELATMGSDADHALQLIEGGQRTQAFAAVRGILEHLPLTFLWSPLLRIWPVSTLGERVYRAVAARRRCRLHWSSEAS